MSASPAPVAAVLAVLVHAGRILLVRRANAPDQGLWGCPGGRIESGETIFAAAERELREETGVEGRATRLLDALDLFERGGDGRLCHHFILLAVTCDWLSGEPVAADDASEAAWFEIQDLRDQDPRFSVDVASIARRANRPAP